MSKDIDILHAELQKKQAEAQTISLQLQCLRMKETIDLLIKAVDDLESLAERSQEIRNTLKEDAVAGVYPMNVNLNTAVRDVEKYSLSISRYVDGIFNRLGISFEDKLVQ